MESKNKAVIKSLIAGILEDTFWVDQMGVTISLKDAINKNIKLGKGGDIDTLDRNDLLGAYTAFQIRRQVFSENAHGMNNMDLVNRIKLFIFEEATEQMECVNEELGINKKTNIRKTA